MKKNYVLWISKIAIFASISIILYLLKFPLPFIFPGFLEIQFSNLPAIIGGFSLGPIGGVLILLVRTIVLLPLSKTAFVGDIADLIIGLIVVVTSSLIYKKNKTKKGGIIALIVGAFAWVLSAIIANYYILVPAYLRLFFTKDGINGFIGECNIITSLFGVEMNTSNYKEIYVLYGALPFNILISSVVMVVTFIVYKRISYLIHDIDEKVNSKKNDVN